MTSQPRSDESILAEAVQKATPEELAAFLDAACGDDDTLRSRVETLLKSASQSESGSGTASTGSTVWKTVFSLIGCVIGGCLSFHVAADLFVAHKGVVQPRRVKKLRWASSTLAIRN